MNSHRTEQRTEARTDPRISRLRELVPLMHNRSTKYAARLRASTAALEYNKIFDSLPGSLRRGFERGRV